MLVVSKSSHQRRFWRHQSKTGSRQGRADRQPLTPPAVPYYLPALLAVCSRLFPLSSVGGKLVLNSVGPTEELAPHAANAKTRPAYVEVHYVKECSWPNLAPYHCDTLAPKKQVLKQPRSQAFATLPLTSCHHSLVEHLAQYSRLVDGVCVSALLSQNRPAPRHNSCLHGTASSCLRLVFLYSRLTQLHSSSSTLFPPRPAPLPTPNPARVPTRSQPKCQVSIPKPPAS